MFSIKIIVTWIATLSLFAGQIANVLATPCWAYDKPRRDHWLDSREIHMKAIQEATSPIDFILWGDSITAFHSGIVVSSKTGGTDKVWKDKYKGLNAIPAGIAGDAIGQVRWRIENGEMPPSNPRVIGFLIGVNNINWGHDDPDMIRVQYFELLKYAARSMPRSRILVIGLLPAKYTNTKKFNRRLEYMLQNERTIPDTVEYIDCGGGVSVTKSGYYADAVHPNEEGHKYFHTCISKKVREMVDKPPLTAREYAKNKCIGYYGKRRGWCIGYHKKRF